MLTVFSTLFSNFVEYTARLFLVIEKPKIHIYLIIILLS